MKQSHGIAAREHKERKDISDFSCSLRSFAANFCREKKDIRHFITDKIHLESVFIRVHLWLNF